MTEYIEIPEDLALYIEGLMYETNARKDLLSFIMHQENFNQERFKEYHNEYINFYTKYELAKKEMEENYILNKYKDKQVSWTLNFKTHTLEVKT